jgi:hypothetical protein
MKTVKILCGLVCFLILVSNVWTISRWNESRGVYDDICYLRQAHLFQEFGLDGLDTNISRDDDHYLASKLKEIGFATWANPATAPCHSLMPATQRRVMQYPPGTGFALALFPDGFQVIPLYVSATVVVFGFVLLAISLVRTGPAILMAPTLLANAINAGSAFTTTYGAADTVPPDFNFGIVWRYAADMQFVLLVLASAWTALILRLNRGNGITQTALVAAGNLLVNLAFFMSHPVFTPYYTIPVAVLSLWSLLFAGLMQPAEAVNVDFPGRPARA